MIYDKEWLKLEKNQFMILTMLLDKKNFNGNLTEICKYFNLSSTHRSRTKFKNAIEDLQKLNIISSNKDGTTYHLSIKSKEQFQKIEVKDNWIDLKRMRKGHFSESVHWVQVLKVLLWLIDNKDNEFTNDNIANDTNISVTTINVAKKVLKYDFNALRIDYVYFPIVNGEIRRKGQLNTINAFTSTPKLK